MDPQKKGYAGKPDGAKQDGRGGVFGGLSDFGSFDSSSASPLSPASPASSASPAPRDNTSRFSNGGSSNDAPSLGASFSEGPFDRDVRHGVAADPAARRQALEGKISELLREFKISTSLWGTGPHKTFRALVDEIERGEAALDMFDGKLYRFASVVRVDVRYTCPNEGTSLQLYEAEQRFSNGRCRTRGGDFAVWEKLKVGETPESGVSRALHEELGIRGPIFVVPGESVTMHRPPLDFPGIPCRLTAHDYTASMRPQQFNPAGYEEHQSDKVTYFRWRPAETPVRRGSMKLTSISVDGIERIAESNSQGHHGKTSTGFDTER
jgi:hypothetical protein